MMLSPDDWSLWDEHTDASGRRFLANRISGETKWLWQKWDLDGQLFCQNIRTKERLWQSAMDLAKKIETGVATKAEVAAFHGTGPPNAIPRQGMQQYQHQQQNRALVSNGFYGGANGAGQHYPHQQFPAHGPQTQGYPPHPNTGGQPPYASVSAAGTVLGNGSVHGPHYVQHHATTSMPAVIPQNGFNGHAYMQQPPPPGQQFPPGPAPWNHTPYQAPQQRELLVQPPEQYGSASVTSGAGGPNSGMGMQWNNPSNPTNHPNLPHHSRSFRQDSVQNSSAFRGRAINAKRSAENVYNQHGRGRFWNADNTTNQTKRSKFSDARNSDTDSNHWVQNNAGPALKTNNRPPIHSTVRPKPASLVAETVPLRRRNSKFIPGSEAAKALLSASTSKVKCSSKVALMHDHDFAVGSKQGQNANTVRFGGFDEEDVNCDPVIGLCQTVEKDYLRLTSAPKPADVRPPAILKKALKNVKSRWRNQEADYDWVCRQLKSIRQDYKVQHVDTSDTADVYETHARLALENGDLGEFNACVAQAQSLYEKVERKEVVKDEFSAYRILYNLLVGASEWEHSKLLSQFSAYERKRVATRFALDVRRSFLSNNYHLFFVLCANQPPRTMVSFLLDLLAPSIRSRALASCVVAYGPTTLPASFVLSELGWKEDLEPDDDMDSDSSYSRESPEIEKDMTKTLRHLRLTNEPMWVQKALSFLIGINAVFEFVGQDPHTGIAGLVLNCKATKQKGVLSVSGKGLITHAGATR